MKSITRILVIAGVAVAASLIMLIIASVSAGLGATGLLIGLAIIWVVALGAIVGSGVTSSRKQARLDAASQAYGGTNYKNY